MKALLVSMAALGALAMATPASAHDYSGAGYAPAASYQGGGYAERSGVQLERLRMRLREGLRVGAINGWEARRLFSRLHGLEQLRFQYLRTRGMSPWEARDLDARIQALRFDIRSEYSDARFSGRYDNDPAFRGYDAERSFRDAPFSDDDNRPSRDPRAGGSNRR